MNNNSLPRDSPPIIELPSDYKMEGFAVRTPSPFDLEVERIKQEMAVDDGEPYAGPSMLQKPEPPNNDLPKNPFRALGTATAKTQKATPKPPTPDISRLRELANQGDEGALASLTQLLDTNPDNWQKLGDLAATAENLMFQRVAGSDWLATESLRRKANALREELTPPAPTPLERLAIQRVVACWLQMQYLDAVEASSQRLTPIQATQWARRQESAERRYQVAVKSLGLARRLRKLSRREPAAPMA